MGYTRCVIAGTASRSGSSPLAWGIQSRSPVSPRFSSGSSPLAWGIRQISVVSHVLTSGSSPLAWGIRLPFAGIGSGSGSSPLAWGIHMVKHLSFLLVRFIPTRVGYTVGSGRLLLYLYGSSPLAWGIPFPDIAAHVGDSGSSPLAWGIRGMEQVKLATTTVHPHSRGVYIL